MEGTEKVYALLNERGGYLRTREARENGLENKTLQRMVEQGLMDRLAHGLYLDSRHLPDPFFVAQYRCPKGIFSNETALFLHDLSDRNPLRLMMTIPSGWNTKLLKDGDFLFFYSSPQKMRLGVCEMETPYGMKVAAYDIERTLCDCIRNIDRLDRDLVLTALKRYARSKGRDSAKLLEYADALKIRQMAYRYLEVLA